MATSIVHEDRVGRLDDGGRTPATDGGHVLYWMQRACRAEHNDALEFSVRLANDQDVPLHVVFGLTADYPEASGRHFRFLLEGLAEVATALAARGIPFAVRPGHPTDVARAAAEGAVEVVTDRAYQRHLVAWRRDLVAALDVPVWQVEADVVVPVEVTSGKREYAARTIRRKVQEQRDPYLQELTTTALVHTGDPLPDGLDLGRDVADLLADLGMADATGSLLTGGTAQARAHLRRFLDDGLAGYGDRKPDPLDPGVSFQSPYLHHGQVSPVWLALQVRDADSADGEDRAAWLEQLLVRRELSVNFVHFAQDDYDAYATLPDWARTTLDEHRDTPRAHVYDREQLRAARTHDIAWNACMTLARETGYLHNHLRMYWGKQVLLWSATPEQAFADLLALNNEHFLDGRDCNSYASVAWVFGLHDRAWQETDVAGKTRPMTRNGLESKLGKRRFRAWIAEVEAAHGPLDGE